MTQQEIDCAVAEVTGESLCTVQSRGFGIADPDSTNFDPEACGREPLVVDWDDLEAKRYAKA